MPNVFNKDIFKMGYIILYKHQKGLFGNLIVRQQLKRGFPPDQAQYTHTEISGGGIHSVNIAPPRSKLIEITKKHAGRHICLMKFRDDYYERKGRYKVAYFSATLANKMYDVRGVISFLLKWITHDNRLYFCSEGASWALKKACRKALNGLKPSETMPAHFLNPGHFTKVWEGDIPK